MRLQLRRRPSLALVLATVLATALALLTAACGSDDSKDARAASPDTAGTTAPTPAPAKVTLQGDITVFAAASLTDAFKELGKAFEAANPGTHVTFNFGASSALATQIDQGQPGDVFASADSANMKKVTDKNLAGPPVIFATNIPVVVVPASGSPVKAFEDLVKPGVKLVLATPAVPIGNYSRTIFTNASAASGGISADFSEKALANLKSNEADVRAVLAKVQTGEADAGIVYATDAAVAGAQVKTVPIPEKYNVIARYPIATLTESGHAEGAAGFIAFILSDAGQAILQKYGFGH